MNELGLWAFSQGGKREHEELEPDPQSTDADQGRAEDRVNAFQRGGGPFVAAVEATRMPMVVTDPTVSGNPIVYVNQSFIDLFGYSREEVLGQNYFFLSGPDTDPEVERHIRAAMMADEPLNLEIPLRAKNGREVWAAQFVSPVHDDQGRVIQHFASFWDITRRVRAERRTRRLNEVLESRVKERTQELQTELDRRRALEGVLTESVREKDKLLGQRSVLLHEVNHRAKNSIAMAISMLRLQMVRQGNPGVSEALENAIQRLDHLARIHELLYRQDSNDVQSVDMAGYLTELCLNFSHLRSPEDHRIELTSDADDITLDVDRAINVALIAGEAITNALKHAFPDKRRGAVRVGLHQEGEDVLLSIEDNGIGLPATPRPGSMGMRLIEGMARSLNGTLTIEGERRTRIGVRFPAKLGS
ncbi:PAS domain S-box protein [Microvirga sp. 3-52]|uniref:sensor histidine kinase n=1 Tax=Microvirga sp. 3-52 TaxID=2792425 RepID=UPI001AD3D4F0|nr:PAS domain S-box protein [Microvirga sp. 3-52]MBO1909379.1 PAS domain S-box protein [Microvirga sp. 3-52]MBS7455384.1 PAS domain S-box protein [Microvirga sp. 3-52]